MARPAKPKPSVPPPAGALTDQGATAGAAGALKWISEREAAARRNVETLEAVYKAAVEEERRGNLTLDGRDATDARKIARDNLRDATDSHEAQLKLLHTFDKSVAPEKRDASESITREDGEKAFRNMAIYMRTAASAFLTRAIPAIREAKDDAHAHYECSESFSESIREAVKSAVNESHLPSWAIKAVEVIL